MKVLVTAASKYGATDEIADVIGDVLRTHGLDTTVMPPGQVAAIEDYGAVILGSAVYEGRWLKQARMLAERSAGALAARPVWLFSSGPVGDPAKPEEDPVDVAEIAEATHAREHRVFAGKLTKKQLSFPDRAIVLAFRVSDGDFRDWAQIKDWASEIAGMLRPDADGSPGGVGMGRLLDRAEVAGPAVGRPPGHAG
jgi:menaquinone-dependent protoporphyrinogen oxidase